MANAHQKTTHEGGHRLAEGSRLAADRPPGDESLAYRSGAYPTADEGTGASDRPALRCQPRGGSDLVDARRELLHGDRLGVSDRSGRTLSSGAQPCQLLGTYTRLPQ